MRGLPKVPCASLLVRLKPAARAIVTLATPTATAAAAAVAVTANETVETSTSVTPVLGAVLSKTSVPECDWLRLGVVCPAPLFAPGVYDNHLLQPTETETVRLISLLDYSIAYAYTECVGSHTTEVAAISVYMQQCVLVCG
jgi:hypothetical protein